MNKLKSNSPIPLYYQLRELIKDKIINMEWEYGSEIPSELKLCEEFNLCRATVKQALDGLVNEGLIVRKKGKGSFVVYQKINDNFLLEPSLNTKSKNNIKDYSKLIFSDFIKPDNHLKNILKLNEDEKVYKIQRLHYVNEIPIAIDNHYIHPKWSQKILEENLNEIVISNYLKNSYEFDFSNYKINIQAVLLDDYERELLDFPEINTGMIVEALSFVKDETIMFNRKIYRGDKCNLSFEFSSSNNKMEILNSEISIDK